MHNGLLQAFGFLRSEELTTLTGLYEIDSSNVFAIVQEYDSKLMKLGKWEAYRVYIDIQCMLEGEELIGVVLADSLSPSETYNGEKDIELFKGTGSMVKFSKNHFYIFYPQDAHMTSIAVDEKSQKGRKVIVTVHV